MCLDITKYINTIKKEELDTIDHITRVINSYDINELVTYIEFLCDENEIKYYYTKCHITCPDSAVNTLFHAFRHYHYVAELTIADSSHIHLLRVFLKIHRDFQLEEYRIKVDGKIVLNLKHLESGFNYYLTFDFSANNLIIKRSFFII